MEIGYVANVSWPRSGHHLLVRMLQIYFPGFNYCEHYTPSDCCKAFPCLRDNINMSKNHDFDLLSPINLSIPVVIQLRNFLNSIVSEFEIQVVEGRFEDSEEKFRWFSALRAHTYAKFTEKWLTEDGSKNKVIIFYEELTANPVEELKKVVALYSSTTSYDAERARDVAKTVGGHRVVGDKLLYLPNSGIHDTRIYKEYKYYDEKWFGHLHDIANISLNKNR